MTQPARMFGKALRILAGATCFCGLLAAGAMAQDGGSEGSDAGLREAMRSADADLEAVLERLAEQREEIARERPELARETNGIAAQVREKRRRAELARQERDALVHALGALSEEVGLWRDEKVYIESLLTDFRRQFGAEMTLAEAGGYRDVFAQIDAGGETGMGALLDLAEKAAARLPELRAARVFEGEALDAEGVARSGMFVEAGPVSWFVAEDGSDVAGLVAENRNLQQEVVPGVGDAGAIRGLGEGRGGSPRFDPTLGTAVALDATGGSVLDHIKKGGFWIYPILLLALIATLAAVAKWVQLLRIREMSPSVVRRVLKAVNAGNRKRARGELESVRHPAASVLERGIEMGDKPKDDVEEALYEKYLEAQPPLQRGLALIAIASATAPLLGLLGTVTGMIHTFKLINIFGTGDARSLSSGISEALVTTEFGLVVAIPALILHALLSRKVQGIKAAMEMTSLAYLNGLKERKGDG